MKTIRKIFNKILKYKITKVNYVFADKIVTEEWTLFSVFKFTITKPV